jgi:hypothetical protein
MFTYINDNFLHAPSFDLSRETVKTLIHIMLAQAQEVFLEKQVADQKKVGMLAKLAAQSGYLYGQAIEGVQENVNKAIFEKVWLTMVQVCDSKLAPFGRLVAFSYRRPQSPYMTDTTSHHTDQKQSAQLHGSILSRPSRR